MVYRYVVKFSNGKHMVGVVQSLSYCRAEIFELERMTRKMQCKINSIDIWRCKK